MNTQNELIKYVHKRISHMPKIYREAPTYAIYGAEILEVISQLGKIEKLSLLQKLIKNLS